MSSVNSEPNTEEVEVLELQYEKLPQLFTKEELMTMTQAELADKFLSIQTILNDVHKLWRDEAKGANALRFDCGKAKEDAKKLKTELNVTKATLTAQKSGVSIDFKTLDPQLCNLFQSMRDRLHTQSQRLAEVTNELERAKKMMATSPEHRGAFFLTPEEKEAAAILFRRDQAKIDRLTEQLAVANEAVGGLTMAVEGLKKENSTLSDTLLYRDQRIALLEMTNEKAGVELPPSVTPAQEVVESGRTTSGGTSPQPAKRRISADGGTATAAPAAKKVAVIETDAISDDELDYENMMMDEYIADDSDGDHSPKRVTVKEELTVFREISPTPISSTTIVSSSAENMAAAVMATIHGDSADNPSSSGAARQDVVVVVDSRPSSRSAAVIEVSDDEDEIVVRV